MEETSDTEFEALLPEGLVNGRMAKLSMGSGLRAKASLAISAPVNEFSGSKTEQRFECNDSAANKPQEDVEM